ncbi:PEP-CTERM sorting domain-containing protein [Geomesophilobacter sediminis]|uniref:PEP-CTERM sorting domain-containing protein n=1 Tax=Geomesophilobacter sediminis TaxID=2798584 RepID=A0A8J7INN0_9BACT|nr:PEP-CTERM sorting domain-containing protein [Geomesophilobacter sediminis]MBJ6723709.1 PEP-CTERM sorting domain-containing protein [Geomesophilobacter sediminis]
MTLNHTRRCLRMLLLFIALLAATFAAVPAGATQINVPYTYFPDLNSAFIGVGYDYGSSTFTANGYVNTYQKSSDSSSLTDAYFLSSFSLTAAISHSGVFSSGSLDIENINDPSTPLLTGNLIALGYDKNDPVMQFLFNNVGGSLKDDFGSQVLVILGNSGFDLATDGFGASFNNYEFSDAVSDTHPAPVPEPGTVTLLLFGGAGLFLARLRKSTRRG